MEGWMSTRRFIRCQHMVISLLSPPQYLRCFLMLICRVPTHIWGAQFKTSSAVSSHGSSEDCVAEYRFKPTCGESPPAGSCGPHMFPPTQPRHHGRNCLDCTSNCSTDWIYPLRHVILLNSIHISKQMLPDAFDMFICIALCAMKPTASGIGRHTVV